MIRKGIFAMKLGRAKELCSVKDKNKRISEITKACITYFFSWCPQKIWNSGILGSVFLHLSFLIHGKGSHVSLD
jgi:hypothetical protein